MNRDALSAVLLQKSPLYISQDDFNFSINEWDLEAMYFQDGTPYLIFLVKGAEFHFSIVSDRAIIGKKELAAYPGSLILKYGHALTKTPVNDLRQKKFNERLGFFKTHEDQEFTYYRIEKMRNTPCH